MRTFIVAMEYRGARLGAGAGGRRVPVCEHAYHLETATLAGHLPGDAPRVGFPATQRGWNSPPRTARCVGCDTAVQGIVRELISAAVSAIISQIPEAAP
jgi:hypothetical protein